MWGLWVLFSILVKKLNSSSTAGRKGPWFGSAIWRCVNCPSFHLIYIKLFFKNLYQYSNYEKNTPINNLKIKKYEKKYRTDSNILHSEKKSNGNLFIETIFQLCTQDQLRNLSHFIIWFEPIGRIFLTIEKFFARLRYFFSLRDGRGRKPRSENLKKLPWLFFSGEKTNGLNF